jgi:hypothetical protein
VPDTKLQLFLGVSVIPRPEDHLAPELLRRLPTRYRRIPQEQSHCVHWSRPSMALRELQSCFERLLGLITPSHLYDFDGLYDPD